MQTTFLHKTIYWLQLQQLTHYILFLNLYMEEVSLMGLGYPTLVQRATREYDGEKNRKAHHVVIIVAFPSQK